MNEIRFSAPNVSAPEPKHKDIPTESLQAKQTGGKRNPSFFIKLLKIKAAIILILVIVFGLSLSKDFLLGLFKEKYEGYSAVFLINGQVYFGKIVEQNKMEIVLNDVYYLQQSSENAVENQLGSSSFGLVKLGNEIHGPTDELFVNRSQVLFYERLRNDSSVVQSITKNK